MAHRLRTIISPTILLLLLQPSGSDPPSLPLLCLEYLYETNIDRGDLVYILQNDNPLLLDDQFYALAMARGNIMMAGLLDNQQQLCCQQSGTPGSFRHGFNRETHYVLVFDGIEELKSELGFLKNHSRFESRSCFLMVFLDKIRGCEERNVDVAAIFELLWNKFYIHNTVLMYCPQGLSTVECFVYTWFPYGQFSSCATNFFNYDQIDRCSMVGGELYVQYLNEAMKRYDFEFQLQLREGNASQSDFSSSDSLNCTTFYPNEAFFTPNRIKWHNFSIPTSKSTVPTGTFELRSRRGNLPSTSWPWSSSRKRAFTRQARAKRPTDFHPTIGALIWAEDRHFFHKVPHDLGGCPVRALVAIWPPMVTDPGRTDWVGMEHKLVLDVARFMNFRLEQQLLGVSRSGQMAGVKVMEEFESHPDADIFFGNLYPDYERHTVFDHSIGYLHDVIQWVVPLAGKQPLWRNLGSAFSPLVWLLLIITTVLFIALYETILALVERPHLPNSPHSALDSLGVMLAMSLPWIPRSTVCRAYFWLWSVFCVHVAIFYQSKMIDILKRPLDGHQISTLDELIDSGMAIGFPVNFAIHLERLNGSAGIERILQRRLECTSETCLGMVGDRRQPFATIGNRMYLRYSAAHQSEPASVFTLDEIVANSFIQIVMQKGLPLRDHINKKIRSLIEAGYLSAVTQIFLAHTKNATRQVEDHVAEVVPLRLSHFQGAYMVLTLGNALAVICCGGEILLGRIKKRLWKVVYPFVI